MLHCGCECREDDSGADADDDAEREEGGEGSPESADVARNEAEDTIQSIRSRVEPAALVLSAVVTGLRVVHMSPCHVARAAHDTCPG